MAYWKFTEHTLVPLEKGGFECTVCGRTWVKSPQSDCPGVRMYGWGAWPEHLLTKKQLGDAGYSTTDKAMPPPAGGCWREKSPNGIMFLYDRNTATTKKPVSETAKAARAEAAKRTAEKWRCKRCGRRVERYRYGTGHCSDCFDFVQSVEWAEKELSKPDGFVVLDCEATGLRAYYNEIIQLAVLSGRGESLLNTLVKPIYPERMFERGGRHDLCAYDIHGIHPDSLEFAPNFRQIYQQLQKAIRGKVVLIYNASFDHNMLLAACEYYNLPRLKARYWVDVMGWYSQWHGEKRRDGSYRWQALNGGHDALGDCQAVIGVLKRMAGKKEVVGEME